MSSPRKVRGWKPPRSREALLLHYFQELPLKEVAAILGLSPGGARTLLYRARLQLYMKSASGTTYYTTNLTACEHTNTTTTTVNATCTAAGSVTETCNDCGAILSSTTLPILSHNWVAGKAVAPTCNVQGYTVYT